MTVSNNNNFDSIVRYKLFVTLFEDL